MSHNMQTFRITDIVAHHDGLKSFYVERPFTIKPGQFVTVWLPGIDEKPFSVSDMTADHLEITVKAVGPFTKELMNRRKGEYIGLRGPFGKGFALKDNTLLVGGGIGSMIRISGVVAACATVNAAGKEGRLILICLIPTLILTALSLLAAWILYF